MQNIEIKANYQDFEFARSCIQELGGTFRGLSNQRDVYFVCQRGRLKLRVTNEKNGELIFYRRPDISGPKLSEYQIFLCPEHASLEAILRASLDVAAVVEKQRELYLIDNVRVHLDRVSELGRFIEFEAVLSPGMDYEEEKQKLNELVNRFRIEPGQLVTHSYLDLMLKRKNLP